jgi:hypothetical protein
VVSGRRLETGGDIANLTADEWLERWRRFCKIYPQYPPLLRSPEQQLGWHRRETAAAVGVRDWFAALWHLDRLLEKRPGDTEARRQRDTVRAAKGSSVH